MEVEIDKKGKIKCNVIYETKIQWERGFLKTHSNCRTDDGNQFVNAE